jgi:hypothetical protein
MQVESKGAVRANRHEGRFLVAVVALSGVLLGPLAGHTADSKGGAAAKSTEVTFESIPGSTAKRVILTKKAAERLDIQYGKVSEDVIVPKQMVSGLVIAPLGKEAQANPTGGTFGGFVKPAATPAPKPGAAKALSPSGEVWLQVMLSPAEWERLAKDKPARVLALPTRTKLAKEVTATLSPRPPAEDTKRSMLTVYYVVSGTDSGLELGNRMRVELPLAGNDEKQKVVPYSSVYYDAKGAAWAYVNGKPLTYERQKIVVNRVVGDVAVLSEGPPVGTAVVIAGAPLLYGTEVFGK